MNEANLIELNLDSRNISLWNELKLHYKISVAPSDEKNYLLNSKDGGFTVFVDIHDVNPASFTHELLHLKLKSIGMLATRYFKDRISSNDILDYIFSKNLEDHVTNCLEHQKTYPMFLELGYNKLDFLDDMREAKLTPRELKVIRSSFKNEGIIDKDILDLFIGKFFATKSCLSGRSYHKELLALRKIEPYLYDLLKEFWLDWIDFSVDEPSEEYEKIIDIFIEDLNSWTNEKRII